MVEELMQCLKELESAREELARQVENSVASLAELDDKISKLKSKIEEQQAL